MTTQTEAERLADELYSDRWITHGPQWGYDAAAELRRLESANTELQAEILEQCRINGMSAEREDALRAEVERLKKATPQAQEEPATLPEGKKLILVDGSFDDLMYWLERCEEKGHLENCPDLVEPLQNFSYKAYTTPQAQPRREWVGLTDEERDRIWSSYRVSFVAIGHIESKLREKNT